MLVRQRSRVGGGGTQWCPNARPQVKAWIRRACLCQATVEPQRHDQPPDPARFQPCRLSAFASAGLLFDPQPESERGLSVTMGQDWGGEATGGIDALFAANLLEQRSGVEGTSRWTLEVAYGLPAFAGRFTGAPCLM